jgi:hypothetical protein
VPPGKETVAVSIDGVPKLESAGLEAEYVVTYDLALETGTIHGKRSLFMLLDKADLMLIVPDKLLQGQSTKIRAILIDPRTNKPLAKQKITLLTQMAEGGEKSFEAESDDRGMALFEMSADDLGTMTLEAKVAEGEAEGEIEANVEIVRESKLMLTLDKPMYQPGQLMHIRTLALNRFDKAPEADQDIIFEVLDAKGNKVFKRADKTNEFGIGWAQFQLATQVLLGPYTIRATMGDVVSEKTVTVDRYSLPKFKVQASVDKSFYMPGQTVLGEVQVDYFFGKPVAGGKVAVTFYKYVAEWQPDIVIEGKTNDEGLYKFQYQLPDYLVGQPIEDGKALVMMEVAVTDTAEHEQKVAKNLLVTSNLLDIVVIPESGEVVPDVVNVFYVFASDPTGAPAKGTAKLTINGAEFDDDEDTVAITGLGPAKVGLLPHQGTLKVGVEVTDDAGNKASRSFDFSVGAGEANILLRTDRALYKVGESMEVSVTITGGYSHVFLDVVRKNQTVLTKTLETEEGQASLIVDLDAELSEDLLLDAYMLADSGQFIRDSKVVYVQPASDLLVDIKLDKDEYLPGETATVGFEVKGEDNQPVAAALGLQVVDEAVYALSEIKPGLEKLYFQLEQELAEPTYQVGVGNGFSLGGLILSEAEAEPGSAEEKGIQDTTAAAFAALDGTPLGQQRLSSWDKALTGAKEALNPFFQARNDQIMDKLEKKLSYLRVDYDQACSFLTEYLSVPRFYDFWDNPYEFVITEQDWDCSIEVKSRGADESLGTEDDWSAKYNIWDLSRDEWMGGAKATGAADEDGGDWAFAEGEDNAGPPEAAPGDPQNADEHSGGGGDKSAVKVRKWFPETLFVEPALITDGDGKAEVEIPLADSITEWRMTTMASSMQGQLGSRADGIVVFQDFFVDIDFPKYLTQNDEIQFPIAVYNYLETAQSVNVELLPEEWFELMGQDKATLDLEAGEVSVVYFPVKVAKVGWHKLTVYGMGDKFQDAVERTVEVKPDGKEIVVTESARFDNDGENPSQDTVTVDAVFPEGSITGSQTVVVKVLPGLSTHIVEGMESMLQLPGG